MSEKLVFYEIFSNYPNRSVSPWCYKVRLALNYKGIPYDTVWEIHPKIEGLAKSIGAPPTGSKPDGTPSYSLPIIQDRAKGVVVSDSTKILAYLDKAYPTATPKFNPEGCDTLQKAFRAAFRSKVPAYFALVLPIAITNLPAESQGYCAIGWAPFLGENWVEPKVALKTVQEAFNEFSSWMEEGQVFVMGDHPIDTDFEIGGFLAFMKKGLGEDSEEWKEIITWNNGRWGKLLQALEKY